MWSIWNAPSDRDYYGQYGFSEDEPEPEDELERDNNLEISDETNGEKR